MLNKKIFLMAGEPSGDALGASLMRALKAQAPGVNLEFLGIGGPAMESEGLKSLIPMEELTIMGVWEAVSHLPRLLKLRSAIVEEIEKQDVDAFVSIDFPDFNFLVSSRLKKRGRSNAKIIHYVAPTVWAWRPGRAKAVSKFLDGLMCLFPFEPEYFDLHGLDAVFVGHPVVENDLKTLEPDKFREDIGVKPESMILGVFFGSREEELEKMSETLRDTIETVLEHTQDLSIIAPTLKHLEYNVLQILEGIDVPVYVLSDPDKKWQAIAACDIALAVSGTVGLELAYAGVPHVIAYKAHPLTALLARFLVKIKYAHLANILLDKPAVPEFLQRQCDPLKIARALLSMIKKQDVRQKQLEDLHGIRDLLLPREGRTPSQNAAEFVLRKIM